MQGYTKHGGRSQAQYSDISAMPASGFTIEQIIMSIEPIQHLRQFTTYVMRFEENKALMEKALELRLGTVSK